MASFNPEFEPNYVGNIFRGLFGQIIFKSSADHKIYCVVGPLIEVHFLCADGKTFDRQLFQDCLRNPIYRQYFRERISFGDQQTLGLSSTLEVSGTVKIVDLFITGLHVKDGGM